jgi:hypothetical protein
MSGGFTMTPSIVDNDARNHNAAGCSVRITFEPGHMDDYARACFDVLVLVDDERMAALTLHYEAATALCKALKGAMRDDR